VGHNNNQNNQNNIFMPTKPSSAYNQGAAAYGIGMAKAKTFK
jgi:hypothetical protein